MNKADFRHANLVESHLSGARMRGADLSDAKLYGADYGKTTEFPVLFNPLRKKEMSSDY